MLSLFACLHSKFKFGKENNVGISMNDTTSVYHYFIYPFPATLATTYGTERDTDFSTALQQ